MNCFTTRSAAAAIAGELDPRTWQNRSKRKPDALLIHANGSTSPLFLATDKATLARVYDRAVTDHSQVLTEK
jgi:hypothetical protein